MTILDTRITELKNTLYSKNITQAQFSRMTGIAYPQLCSYCNGVNVPGKIIQEKIAIALKVSVSEIFPK